MKEESKIILELKKVVKTKSFWIQISIAILITIIITVAMLFGFLFFIIYTYTDYSVVAETEPLTKFPEEWIYKKEKSST